MQQASLILNTWILFQQRVVQLVVQNNKRHWYWLVWHQWIAMVLLYPAMPNRHQYPPISGSYDVITTPTLSKMVHLCILVLRKWENYWFTLVFCTVSVFDPYLFVNSWRKTFVLNNYLNVLDFKCIFTIFAVSYTTFNRGLRYVVIAPRFRAILIVLWCFWIEEDHSRLTSTDTK